MKYFTFTKATMIISFIAFGVFLFVSCGNLQRSEDTKDISEDLNETKFDNNQQQRDAQFLVKAAVINLEEIKLGQLAEQNGKTMHVKGLGKMMIEAHTKSLNAVKVLAKSKMISIPDSVTEDVSDTYNSLNEKSGNEFDKAYADLMVSGHKDAIVAFEKVSTDCEDNDIKNWAFASLPDLRTHLDHSKDCQKKCSKM
jgi:putative membrane protein